MLPATGQKRGKARERVRGQVEPGVYVDMLLESRG